MPPATNAAPTAHSATTRAFVQWIRSAAPYIHAFRGKTFVIAFGGEVVADDTFLGIIHDLNLLHSLGVHIVVVHGSRPQIEAILAAAGHREPLRLRPAGHRRRDDGLRARGRRPGAQPHRGAALARHRELADGGRAHPRVVGQLHHREADGRRRRRRHAADRRGAARRHRRDPPAPRRRRHRADLAARLLAHRRDLQPRAGGSRDPGRGPPRRAQARVPDGDRRRAQRPPAAPHRAVDARRRGAARAARGKLAADVQHYLPCAIKRLRQRRACARISSAATSTARCCSSSSRATAWAR